MVETNNRVLFKRHYPELDLVRAVAITIVMFAHFGERFVTPPGFLTKLIAWGWNGVGLFFVLSGFLIGGQILEEARSGEFSLKKFYFKRLLRIFPAYYFSLVVLGLLFFTGLSDGNIADTDSVSVFFKDFFLHLVYLQNYFVSVLQRDLYWSLAVEEQFYILAPLLLVFLAGRSWRLTGLWVAFLIAAGLAVRHLVYGPDIDWMYGVRLPFHTRFDSLLFGVLSAYLFIKYFKFFGAGEDGASKARPLVLALLLAGAVAGIGCIFLYGAHSGGYFNTCWQFTVGGLGFSSLILFLIFARAGRFIYPKKFFSTVAGYSYTMYLYHYILVVPVVKAMKGIVTVSSHAEFIVLFVIYFLIVLAVSAMLNRVVERPFMNYRKKVLSKWTEGR